ncbi:MAG: thiamine phosphate synthase [Helicobacteraceae bacterium CG2_30_36_10]|nr:MAG: thiamine phosphate synthase [Helicobacteraceae bacterium CG2_30_36_10]
MKKYLITSKEFYTDTPDIFKEKLQKQFEIHMPDFALYRDKENPNYAKQAEDFMDVCSEFTGVKSFIHRHVELAVELKATGVHLTSTQFDEIAQASANNLKVIMSTHTHEEVLLAQKLGANYVTYSPIFASPNKGKPKGVEDLQALLKKCTIKVFALGGILDASQVQSVSESGAFGFASIRYFYS